MVEMLQNDNEINIKTREEYFINLVILFISVYSFFGYLIPMLFQYLLLAVSCIGLVFYSLLKGNKIKSQHIKSLVLVILFNILLVLSIPYSSFPQTSLKATIHITTMVAIGFFLGTQTNWFEKCLKYFISFSLIHSFFTLVSYAFPNFFLRAILRLLPAEIGDASRLFMTYGLYAGITEQIGRNAFYITVGIAIVFASVIKKKKSIRSIILIFMFILTLLLTGKRGHLLANLFSIIIIIVVNAKMEKQNVILKTFLFVVIVISIVALIIFIIPQAATPFIRFMVDEGTDITSGRLVLYKHAIELFKQKPIFGWGLGSFAWFENKGTHNIYLQLLCENGIIGASIFVIILFLNISTTLRTIKEQFEMNVMKHEKYLLFSLYIQVFFISYGITGNPINDGFIFIIYMVASSMPYAMKID